MKTIDIFTDADPSFINNLSRFVNETGPTLNELLNKLGVVDTTTRACVLREVLRGRGITNTRVMGLDTPGGHLEFFLGITNGNQAVGGVRCNSKGIYSQTMGEIVEENGFSSISDVVPESAEMIAHLNSGGKEGFTRIVGSVRSGIGDQSGEA